MNTQSVDMEKRKRRIDLILVLLPLNSSRHVRMRELVQGALNMSQKAWKYRWSELQVYAQQQ